MRVPCLATDSPRGRWGSMGTKYRGHIGYYRQYYGLTSTMPLWQSCRDSEVDLKIVNPCLSNAGLYPCPSWSCISKLHSIPTLFAQPISATATAAASATAS